MQAIEFNTHSYNGQISIPDHYSDWFETHLKVILLAPTQTLSPPTQVPSPTVAVAEAMAFFEQLHLDLSHYHFNRDEANER